MRTACRFVPRLVTIVAAWASVAAAGAEPNAKPIQPRADGSPFKVACIGDSITYGSMVSPGYDDYPTVLGRLLGKRFTTGNFGAVAMNLCKSTGYSYFTTQQFKDAKAFAPDVVTIMLGTNDAKCGRIKDGKWTVHDEFCRDYAQLIADFQNLPSHPSVWVMLPVPACGETAFGIKGSLVEKGVGPAARAVAEKASLGAIDLFTPLRDRPEDFPDDVHPNRQGHARMAQVVYAGLTGQPLILPAGGVFAGPVQVKLSSNVAPAEIRYTLDGTEPGDDSTLYSAPLTVKASTTLKAKTFGERVTKGSRASFVEFKIAAPRPAATPAATAPGLAYNFYREEAKVLDDPTEAKPVETGVAADFGKLPHQEEKGCGFLLTGFILVPADGVYAFNIQSYDTSVLFIDDQMLINNGGSKGLHVCATGQIALAAGRHKIRIIYSLATGNGGLGLRYAGPGVPLKPVPVSVFSHAPQSK